MLLCVKEVNVGASFLSEWCGTGGRETEVGSLELLLV